MRLRPGDIVVARYGIHGDDYHIPAGRRGSVQIVNGEHVHVLFDGTHANRKVPWPYLDKVEAAS